MWFYITFIHCPSIPIGYSKNHYLIIMIVYSWSNRILFFDKVVYQQIFLCLVRWFEVYLLLKTAMLHVQGHQIQLFIDITNSFLRSQRFSTIQWCLELFWFIFCSWYLYNMPSKVHIDLFLWWNVRPAQYLKNKVW